MVIVGYEPSNPSSNPGQDCHNLHSVNTFGKDMNQTILPSIYGEIVGQTRNWFRRKTLNSNQLYSIKKLTLCHTLLVTGVLSKYYLELMYMCIKAFRNKRTYSVIYDTTVATTINSLTSDQYFESINPVV